MQTIYPICPAIDIYSCNDCQYFTPRKSDYMKHCNTKKHIIKTQLSNTTYCISSVLICNGCNRQYKDRSGLWRHKKRCFSKDETSSAFPVSAKKCGSGSESESESESESKEIFPAKHNNTQQPHLYDDIAIPLPKPASHNANESSQPLSNIQNELLMKFIKQNQELKDILMEERKIIKDMFSEQNAKIDEISNKQSIVINNNTNNNNTTHFNLNIFLNEKCKDAITIMDFVNSLQVNTSDVEYTGRYGYVEGITKIFINGLKQLDIYKRPIHCTDLKRETLYIKEENSWEKDPQRVRLKTAIGTVVRKNVQQIAKWEYENPRCNILDSKEYVLHLTIMRQSLGGGDFEKTDRNNEKIIRNIAKEVLINRKII